MPTASTHHAKEKGNERWKGFRKKGREERKVQRIRLTKHCKIIMQETISKQMLQKHTQTIYEWAGPQLCDCTTTALGSQGGDYSEGKLGNQFVS